MKMNSRQEVYEKKIVKEKNASMNIFPAATLIALID